MSGDLPILFSQAQLCDLTDVSADTLQNWVKGKTNTAGRALITPAQIGAGRGRPHKYDLLNVVKVQTLAHFSRAGLHISYAEMIFEHIEQLAIDLAARCAAADNEGAETPGRNYRYWIINVANAGLIAAEYVQTADGQLRRNDGGRGAPPSGAWFAVDEYLNEWVLDAVEWWRAGTPTPHLQWRIANLGAQR